MWPWGGKRRARSKAGAKAASSPNRLCHGRILKSRTADPIAIDQAGTSERLCDARCGAHAAVHQRIEAVETGVLALVDAGVADPRIGVLDDARVADLTAVRVSAVRLIDVPVVGRRCVMA